MPFVNKERISYSYINLRCDINKRLPDGGRLMQTSMISPVVIVYVHVHSSQCYFCSVYPEEVKI